MIGAKVIANIKPTQNHKTGPRLKIEVSDFFMLH